MDRYLGDPNAKRFAKVFITPHKATLVRFDNFYSSAVVQNLTCSSTLSGLEKPIDLNLFWFRICL